MAEKPAIPRTSALNEAKKKYKTRASKVWRNGMKWYLSTTGWTWENIAKFFGVKPITVRRHVMKSDPKLSEIMFWCEFFKIDPSFFFERQKEFALEYHLNVLKESSLQLLDPDEYYKAREREWKARKSVYNRMYREKKKVIEKEALQQDRERKKAVSQRMKNMNLAKKKAVTKRRRENVEKLAVERRNRRKAKKLEAVARVLAAEHVAETPENTD